MTDTPSASRTAAPLSEAVFQILLALVDEDRHGYAIMREVEDHTAGRLRLGPGTLYGAIRRLREQGLIVEVEVGDGSAVDGEDRRRNYRLTELGRDVARREAARLELLVSAARVKRLIPGSETS